MNSISIAFLNVFVAVLIVVAIFLGIEAYQNITAFIDTLEEVK